MKKTITLSGKKINLRFGARCWEGVVSMADRSTSPSAAMSTLIYSAMQNDDEFTKVSQGFSFEEIDELVDTGLMIEGESKELAECESIFQDSVKYKEFLKYSDKPKDKKKEPRKK